MVGLPDGEKIEDKTDMYNRLDTIYRRETDRRTDGHLATA